ncbi:TonB-dependent receptor [Echinicola jeungdonensis]|uniref:TonB-dependent receptor domain-containing protein n=1 Tax=Echinicola jeungdonensis TaxID=709343 RepID=A0ABV5J050_9BACT|nr:TonB-dependent receptor [Echinicola jeungdonensis]MDN3671192.1 TonB-dependent receptor [Echinicola jeungdonensis]
MKIYLKIQWILLLLFSFVSGQILAQEKTISQKGGFQLTGKVIEKESGNSISYATIQLLDAKSSKQIAGAVADDQGEFFITGFEVGSYKVQVNFVGFETKTLEDVKIQEGQTLLNLGKIGLQEESVSLEEVTVQGQRELIEEKVDRTIYNAENDKTTVGGDATDVLRRVPMLSVDLDGNVSLRGSQNIRVLIDNKPSTMSASSIADALKQIPADEIKSVEVITSPSAKYDAEGSGGVINIVTKKNNLQGTSLSINTSAGMRGSNLGLNASARKGKWGFSLGGFGRAGYNIQGGFENNQLLTNEDGSTSRVVQSADTHTNMLMGRYNFGADYEIDKYNWLAASVNFGMFNFKNKQDNLLTENFQEDELVSALMRRVNMDNFSNTIDVSLNYTRTYEKPQKEFSIMTLYSRNNRTNDFVQALLDGDFEEIESRTKNENASNNQEFTFQLDYITPLGEGENQILEYGAKNILRRVNSDYVYFSAQGPDGDYLENTDATFSNAFNYDQNVTAGYLSYTLGFWDNYTVKAGMRYEYTHIDADFESGEQEAEIPSYGVWVPSVNLSRKLKNGNMIKAAYNRRIQRPSLRYLNPNIQGSNPSIITQGNPLLDPEFTDNYELSYSTYWDKASFNFSSFFRNSSGAIQPVRSIQEDGVIYTTYENIGSEKAYGLSLFSNINISDKFSLNGSIDGYYTQIDNNVSDLQYQASNNGFVVSGRVFGNYNITDSWVLQGFGFARGRRVNLQGYDSGFGIYGLNINKQFKEKKGSIGIGAENFFTPEFKMRNEINSATISQQSTNMMRNMNFKINFSYRIGKMSVGPKRKKKSIENNDMDSGGGQNMMGPGQ